MPTSLLLRSYFITTILSSPLLLKLSMPLLSIIANSSSPFFNPDKNPIVGIPVRKIIYDHFVAWDCETEVKKTVQQMKKVGFKGVILGYAKEFAADEGVVGDEENDVRAWRNGYERTMSMIGEGDFMAVK